MPALRRALAPIVLVAAVEPPDVTVRRLGSALRVETAAASARVRIGRYRLQLRDRTTGRIIPAEQQAGELFYERGSVVHGLGFEAEADDPGIGPPHVEEAEGRAVDGEPVATRGLVERRVDREGRQDAHLNRLAAAELDVPLDTILVFQRGAT